MKVKLTENIVQASTGASKQNAAKYLPYLNKYMNKYGINTPQRILAFLSQIGHESAHLNTAVEYASGSAYEGRKDLGNVQSGDGIRFKGRGLIQITGRGNYTALSKATGINFVAHPQLLEQPKYAVEASAWWWKNHNLNEVADGMNLKKPLTDPQNDAAFKRITKIINGGYNGLQQRQSNWMQGQDDVINFINKHPLISALGIASIVLAVGTAIYYFVNEDTIEHDFNIASA